MARKFSGPVRPTTEESIFRETGRSIPKAEVTAVRKQLEVNRAGGGLVTRPTFDRQSAINKQLEAERLAIEKSSRSQTARKQAEQARKQAEQARKTAQLKRARIVKQQKRKQIVKARELRPVDDVQPVIKRKGLEGVRQKLETQRGIIRTKRLRGKDTGKEELKLATLTAVSSVVNTVTGVKQLPSVAFEVVKNPKVLKQVPASLKKSAVNFNVLLQESPTEAVVIIGTELVTLKGSSKAISAVGKGVETGKAFVPFKGKGLLKSGKKIRVTTKEGNVATLDVVNKIPKQSLSQQAKLAGKNVNAVSTIQDKLVGIIKNKKTIRKPIPNEDKLSKSIQNQLKKFDEGKLNKKQILDLDKKIKNAEVKVGFGGKPKGLLERTFFADPRGKIRPSRTGLVKDKKANILDVLSGDVTFKKSKPQILVFGKTPVEDFPKALKGIGRKLKQGKSLTKTESDKLLQFQLKRSGKFKPVGFLTRESEVVLAPNEIIKRVKNVGTTAFRGQSIPITQVKVVKLSTKSKNLINKINKKSTKKDINELSKALTKETGFKVKPSDITSSFKKGRKVVDLKSIVGSVAPTISKTVRFTKVSRGIPSSKKGKRTSKTPVSPTPKRPSKPPSGRPSPPPPSPRPSRPPRKSPPSKPPVRKPPKKPPIIGKTIKPPVKIKLRRKIIRKTKQKKAVAVYDVFGKSKGKFVKLNTKPLKRIDALSRGTFAVDKTTAKTFKIKPVGTSKTFGTLRKNEKGYYNRNKKKLRDFQIKKGKKVKLKNKRIEKRRFGIDTRSEKKGLTIANLLKTKKKVKGGKRKNGNTRTTKKRK